MIAFTKTISLSKCFDVSTEYLITFNITGVNCDNLFSRCQLERVLINKNMHLKNCSLHNKIAIVTFNDSRVACTPSIVRPLM